jgi:hypothetical protein
MRAATFRGYRPCPARPDYVELVAWVDGERLNWCLPGAVDEDEPVAGAGRVELRYYQRAVQLFEREQADAPAASISVSRAVALLGRGGAALFVDEQLCELHQ